MTRLYWLTFQGAGADRRRRARPRVVAGHDGAARGAGGAGGGGRWSSACPATHSARSARSSSASWRRSSPAGTARLLRVGRFHDGRPPGVWPYFVAPGHRRGGRLGRLDPLQGWPARRAGPLGGGPGLDQVLVLSIPFGGRLFNLSNT
ncbi:MAG: hypothetical protein MZW92_24240 [Comamonadaceae bacterium]|nr:hypothetical protein [Comamonadaceae bacterium]